MVIRPLHLQTNGHNNKTTTSRSDMEVTRSTEIKVGLVSLAAILLLIGGIMIGKGINLSPNKAIVNISLSSSGGLENGSPVVVDGVKRGMIVDVRNDGDGVTAVAELDHIDDLHADASAKVTILEITGGKKVSIDPGTTGSFDARMPLKGVVSPDISDLITSVGDVSGDAQSLVRRLDTISAAMTALLGDSVVVRDLRTMASDGSLLVSDLRTFFQANKQPLKETIASLRSLSSELRTAVTENDPKLRQLLDKLDRTADDAAAVLRRADGAVVKADTMLTAANDVLRAVRDRDGTAHRLIYDAAFINKLDSTVQELNTLLLQANKYGINVNVGLGHEP
ncbi:MAG: MCE family protein [Candidatus Kapabacteria bacterium]|nr:MCE family protein [Candidatus Kapabacteria bacterium]